MQKKGGFQVPNQEKRKLAIGSLQKATDLVRNAIEAIIPLCNPIPKPEPSDWLAAHHEEGQSYDDFLRTPRNQVTSARNVIYIQPLEEKVDQDFLKALKLFTEAYYHNIKVEINELYDVKELGVESRINDYSNKPQFNAGHILRSLEKRVPKDAYCMIAVCLTDLYPRDSWNFVFGLASLQSRVGVFSFARYDENFFLEADEKPKPIDKSTIIFRSCMVMVHEIGHMFGLKHCVFYDCIMNGSNHLEESKKRTFHECPVCLRKLQSAVGFNIVERYKALWKTCESLSGHFERAAKWYEQAYNTVMQKYGNNYQTFLEKENASSSNKTSSPSKTTSQSSAKPKGGSILQAKQNVDKQIDLYKDL